MRKYFQLWLATIFVGSGILLVTEPIFAKSLRDLHPKTAAARLDAEFADLQTRDASRLSQDQMALLKLYSGELYRSINQALRAEGTLQDQGVRSMACVMDGALARSGTAFSGLTLYRGGRLEPGTNVVGTEFVDRGFASTSLDINVARKFASFVRGSAVVDTIRFGDGQLVPGLWLDALSYYRESGQWLGEGGQELREFEMLLQRGIRFRVVRVESSWFGSTLERELEVLGIEPPGSDRDCPR